MKYFDFSNLRGDILGGITAGVVALPLGLAFGEASGAGPIAGLWGAILVGFFAALFGGTGAQISGPTGPMIVVFAAVFASLQGEPSLVFAAVVLAGIIQIVMGALRLGQYIKLVPYPVISGFMSGIGAIIIALQVSRLFGHEPDQTGTIPALQSIPGAIIDPVWSALLVGLLSLGLVFFWPKSLGRWIPSPLAALVCGTIVSVLVGVPTALTLGEIPTGLPEFVMPSLTSEAAPIVLEAGLILALLGAIDSLLTSLVADNMTGTRHKSNRELVGQGIGNTVAGLFGAIPGAGATMRTVVNIRSGGSTRISGLCHSVILILVALPLAGLASAIPHAVLAGILVKVGYDIIDWSYLRRALHGPRWDLVLMATVLTLTVFVDLITAVAVGVVLAALAFVKHIADIQIESLKNVESSGNTAEERRLLKLARGRILLFDFAGGPLSFGAAADLGHTVRDRVDEGAQVLVLDFSRVPTVDLSAARAVETILTDAVRAKKSVFVTGVNREVTRLLGGLGADQSLPKDARFDRRIDALQAAIAVLGEIDRNVTGLEASAQGASTESSADSEEDPRTAAGAQMPGGES